MKTRIVLVVLLLALVSSNMLANADGPNMQVMGTVQYTAKTLCWHPDPFRGPMHYFVGDECGHRVYLSGPVQPDWVGQFIWADGYASFPGLCPIFEIYTYTLCDQ